MGTFLGFLLAASLAVTTVTADLADPYGISNKITKGKRAKRNEYPFTVWIGVDDLTCGGSLVDPQWVMTLARCVNERPLANYTVVIGDWKTEESDGEILMNITEIVYYPRNNGSVDDLALLRLYSAVDTSLRNIDVVPLSNLTPARRNECVLSAFGDRVAGMQAEYKQKLDVRFIDEQLCAAETTFVKDGGTLCYEARKSKAKKKHKACNGDEGSPIVCDYDGTLYQVAVNTAGNCESRQMTSRPVADVISWVDSVINPIEYNYHYFFGFLNSLGLPYELNHIYVCAASPTTVAFSHPAILRYLGVDNSIELDGCLDIPLPKSVTEPSNTTGVFTGYGIRVSSIEPVSVYAESLSTVFSLSDTTAVFPQDLISTSYVVGLYTQRSMDKGEFVIVGTAYNTKIVMFDTFNKETWEVTLNKHDVYHYQSSLVSFKTITIEASETVAVFAGHQRTPVHQLNTINETDQLFDQLRPVSMFTGSMFIAPPFGRPDMIVELVSIKDDTSVDVYPQRKVRMSAYESAFFYCNTPIRTQSRNPINAIVYSVGQSYNGVVFKPAIVGAQVLGSIEFKKSYMFYVPEDVSQCWLTLIWIRTNIWLARLDGEELDVIGSTGFPGLNKDYNAYYAAVGPGAHTLESAQVFGANLWTHRNGTDSWFRLM